jgi:hypothetical protein
LRLPCEAWSAIGKCESTVPANQRELLEQHALDLNVACGAAAELLKRN